MTRHRTTCPLDCPDACGVIVEADERGRFVGLRGDPAHAWSRGSLCGKTAIFGEVATSPARQTRPLVRARSGAFEETSWERAIAEIARRVAPLASGEILALSYAGCMGQVARRYPMRVLHPLGAATTDGGICDNTATDGWRTVMGHVVGADIESMEETDLLVLWGVDVRRTHQHMQPRIHALLARGVPVWTIDIYRTDTIRAFEKLGGRSLVIRPGTDAMLALALSRLAYEDGRADREFLARECLGSQEFESHVRGAHDLESAARVTGLSSRAIRELWDALTRSRNPFIKAGVGFTRRRNGGASMRAVCSLGAVLGSADRMHYESSEHFGLATDVLERPERRPADAPSRPIRHVELGAELETGRFEAVFVWGHNPAVTVPDSRRVRAGLARDDLFLVVHELFMTETAELADVVLPATAFIEQSDVFRSYGHRLVHYARRATRPPDEQRSNVDTFRALARELDMDRSIWDVDEDSLCRELLEASRARFTDDEYARILAGEPVKLQQPRFRERGTPSGRIELWSESARRIGQPEMASWSSDDGAGGRGAWQLVAAPSIAMHNSTYSHSARHVARAGPPRCHVHPDDAVELGASEGEPLRLSNEQGSLTLPLALCADLARGMIRVDGMLRGADVPEGVGINALVPSAVSDLGEGSVLYSTRVDVEVAR